jgi:hypothetical protein
LDAGISNRFLLLVYRKGNVQNGVTVQMNQRVPPYSYIIIIKAKDIYIIIHAILYEKSVDGEDVTRG